MPFTATFSGEYDLADKEALRAEFDDLQQKPELILDLSDVTYLDSSFLSELVRLHEARDKAGFATETLVIRKASAVERFIEIAGVARFFNIVQTVSDRVSAREDSLGPGSAIG